MGVVWLSSVRPLVRGADAKGVVACEVVERRAAAKGLWRVGRVAHADGRGTGCSAGAAARGLWLVLLWSGVLRVRGCAALAFDCSIGCSAGGSSCRGGWGWGRGLG